MNDGYLRCSENAMDSWLAALARGFKLDEQNIVEAPPMIDFYSYSKFFSWLFPEVIFTDLLPPGITSK